MGCCGGEASIRKPEKLIATWVVSTQQPPMYPYGTKLGVLLFQGVSTAEHKISRSDVQVRYPLGRATLEQSVQVICANETIAITVIQSAQTIYTQQGKEMTMRRRKLFDMSFVVKKGKGKQVCILPNPERFNRRLDGPIHIFHF